VRLIEAAEILLKQRVDRYEQITLEDARALAVQHLRQIVKDCEPAITAQILMAGDKQVGTANHVMLN